VLCSLWIINKFHQTWLPSHSTLLGRIHRVPAFAPLHFNSLFSSQPLLSCHPITYCSKKERRCFVCNICTYNTMAYAPLKDHDRQRRSFFHSWWKEMKTILDGRLKSWTTNICTLLMLWNPTYLRPSLTDVFSICFFIGTQIIERYGYSITYANITSFPVRGISLLSIHR